MTLFISYSRRDERFATQITDSLLSSGIEVWRFEYVELVDDLHDLLRECKVCIVFFSANSVLTDAVRLSNRLERRHAHPYICIDEDWEPDDQARHVFRSFPFERIAFDHNKMLGRIVRYITHEARALLAPGALSDEFQFGPVLPLDRAQRVADAAARYELLSDPDLPSSVRPPSSPPRLLRASKTLREIMQSHSEDELPKSKKPGQLRKRPALRDLIKPRG